MGVVRSSTSTSETAVVKQIRHLIRRTWWSLRPAEISADEMALVTETLAGEELSLWLCMCRADRSHSVMVARRFTAAEPDAPPSTLRRKISEALSDAFAASVHNTFTASEAMRCLIGGGAGTLLNPVGDLAEWQPDEWSGGVMDRK